MYMYFDCKYIKIKNMTWPFIFFLFIKKTGHNIQKHKKYLTNAKQNIKMMYVFKKDDDKF